MKYGEKYPDAIQHNGLVAHFFGFVAPANPNCENQPNTAKSVKPITMMLTKVPLPLMPTIFTTSSTGRSVRIRTQEMKAYSRAGQGDRHDGEHERADRAYSTIEKSQKKLLA